MIPDISSLPPRIESGVAKDLRSVGLRFKGLKAEPQILVLVANGRLDISVLSILLHGQFDGEKIVSIHRPLELEFSSIGKSISFLMHMGIKQKKFLVVLDQDEISLKDAWSSIEMSLRSHGFSFIEVRRNNRWTLYKCKHGEKELKISIVISGFEKRYVKHRIEDHLLEVALKKGYINEASLSKYNDSKRSLGKFT